MVFAFASMALHHISISVLGILSPAMSLAGGMLAMSLSSSFEEDLNIVLSPEEASASEAFAFSFPAAFEVSSKLPNWLAGEPAPNSFGTTVGEEKGFSSF